MSIARLIIMPVGKDDSKTDFMKRTRGHSTMTEQLDDFINVGYDIAIGKVCREISELTGEDSHKVFKDHKTGPFGKCNKNFYETTLTALQKTRRQLRRKGTIS